MSWARVEADSINSQGIRATTVVARYPRIIHSDFMSHRAFSRNASSSRAMPTLILIMAVFRDMALPVSFGANQAGMQAGAELTGWRLRAVRGIWILTGWIAACMAYLAYKVGVHKQVVNRMIEPWSWITVVMTASEWDNFFELRRHEDADPTIQKLADDIYWAMKASKPRQLEKYEWHLPFVTQAERDRFTITDLIKFSVARCARVSYLTHDKKNPTPEQDLKLYDRLVGARPIHASPTEHQLIESLYPDDVANVKGYRQWRYTVEKMVA